MEQLAQSQHSSQSDCLSSRCHSLGGACQNMPNYGTGAKWACNETTAPTPHTRCTSSGWNAWGSWKNVSSCSKNSSTQCRTVYN